MTAKDDQNIAWYRISDAAGNRRAPQPFSAGSGADDAVDPLSDNHGRVIARLHNGNDFTPSYNATQVQINFGTYIPTVGAVLNASTSNLYQAWGHNSSTTLDGFVMFFGAGGTAGVPEIIIPCNRRESFSLSLVPPGWLFSTQILVAFSSTDLSFTAFAAPLLYVNSISS